MHQVTAHALYVYPVKSLRGVAVTAAEVRPRGFRHDRRFMLVSADGQFMTQRRHPRMALVDVALEPTGLSIHAPGMGTLSVRHDAAAGPAAVHVWGDPVDALDAGEEASAYFSAYLEVRCRLVRMPDAARRPVDARFGQAGDVVSFADGYPFLILSVASLEDLNARLAQPVAMDRFRPNIVLSGCEPYAEDGWSRITLGGVTFRVVKPCDRCAIVTIDPATGSSSKEPLATLASFRAYQGKVLFGQNAIADNLGMIRVGDSGDIVLRSGAANAAGATSTAASTSTASRARSEVRGA